MIKDVYRKRLLLKLLFEISIISGDFPGSLAETLIVRRTLYYGTLISMLIGVCGGLPRITPTTY